MTDFVSHSDEPAGLVRSPQILRRRGALLVFEAHSNKKGAPYCYGGALAFLLWLEYLGVSLIRFYSLLAVTVPSCKMPLLLGYIVYKTFKFQFAELFVEAFA
ncbi:hypothetical protein KP003_08770 [Geomonas nitrogeniifigens]|uniref:Uncharacterized protein n=1 Tax=Geomonas diazotrophica TaxID=2843197 RepID=A0ABX8JNY7_9BACT|nr:hypothetical protein [Geomonas nitrogeniifigens]QWV99302.1 hypothetical protein KP005_08520 [Geomonas nitrogeniifigens]QXE88469.1 hypothetical protein KP003_08770 [Geomonas nitrogeniifigens]